MPQKIKAPKKRGFIIIINSNISFAKMRSNEFFVHVGDIRQ